MYYKKYGELPRILNEKSHAPIKCEFSNQLDKLESMERREKELQNALKEENNANTSKASSSTSQPIQVCLIGIHYHTCCSF
jgi:hypothetical protein